MGEPSCSHNSRARAKASPVSGAVKPVTAGNTAPKALPNEVVAQIADRTDGVPLFVEELTKSILESGLLREAGDRYVLVRQRSRDVYRSRRNVGGRSLRSLSAKASQRLTLL